MVNPDKVLPEKVLEFRSVSQVLQYTRCPYSYYLQRIERAPQRPAAWLPQGTAVHYAVEVFERSGRRLTLVEAQEIAGQKYDEEITALCEVTPFFNEWFASGPYTAERDIPRRYQLTLDQVERYVDYRTTGNGADDWPLLMPDDYLGIEWEFETTFGSVPVRGVIDYIDSAARPVDVKSGNKPGEEFQLATYSGVIQQFTGVEPSTGTFWMGKTGKPTFPYDLSEWSQERLADVFGRVDELIRAEDFPPDPEPSKCMFCSVRAACSFSA